MGRRKKSGDKAVSAVDAAAGIEISGAGDTATTSAKPDRANIKLAGAAEPLGAGQLTVGMRVIGELPNAETQQAGWYCDFARKLVQLFPERFKLIVEKGS